MLQAQCTGLVSIVTLILANTVKEAKISNTEAKRVNPLYTISSV